MTSPPDTETVTAQLRSASVGGEVIGDCQPLRAQTVNYSYLVTNTGNATLSASPRG